MELSSKESGNTNNNLVMGLCDQLLLVVEGDGDLIIWKMWRLGAMEVVVMSVQILEEETLLDWLSSLADGQLVCFRLKW